MKKQSFLCSLFILLLLALFLSKAQISFGDSVETGNETVTGNLVVGGNATITGNVSMSSIENTPIGKNQPNTGRFTDISGTTGSYDFIGVNHMSLTGALGMTAIRITAEDANFVSAKHTSLYATNLNARTVYTEQGVAGAGDLYGFIGSGQSSLVKSGATGLVLTAKGVGTQPSWDRVATQVKAGMFSRDISTVSGTYPVTGVGFTPSLVQFTCFGDGSNTLASIGYDVGGGGLYSQWIDGTGGSNWNGGGAANSINWVFSAGLTYRGYISSMNSDGFTITWTREGNTTGTNYCGYLAFK